ncbi:transcriptional antiterminator/mannitol/fructose-specific phosphotransferase system IIA component (Ntr-type) [Neobacillus niacini]|uniref:BglG family transcription antiterminator n=1 Tax=Neobacillus niacini TaxID=86668 RepID=UPI00285ABB8E|nr:BglG family transcription antiterminator [Neobacillus niacini]MDR7078432.1 transcriptional antiterminator/mannitol/fructose-specific phosphotransferase system IIA component (Ntr-type) [Neobacillus niacini]
MMFDKRPSLLLDYFLKVKSINMNQIMEATQLTKRQISYDLDKVNHWLKEEELPTIQFKGNHSIVVPDEVVEYFRNTEINRHEHDFVFSEEERLAVICLYLFMRNDTISSFHLTQLLQVSKNTVISDIKKANQINCPFLVEIRYSRKSGYHLVGSEIDKRALVMHYISRMIQVPYFEKLLDYLVKEETRKIDYRGIVNILKQIEKQFSLNFVEERLNQLANFLIFYYYRQQKKKFVQFHSDEMALLKKDPMHKVAIRLCQLLQLEEEESELCYLTIQFLGLSFEKSSAPNSEQDLLFKLCQQLVFDFETKACIVFEKRDEVVHTLYQHFKPAFFRMKYRIPVVNPLLNQIKSEHKELYMIVKEILHPIGTLLKITIPEEEIGFVTIHFGALLERPKQEMPEKKKAIVVCPSGISSSLMVKHQLESLFSEIMVEKTLSLREFQEGTVDHYDLVFSTVRLETKLPCFYVKPIMTPNEKHNLVNEVYHLLFGTQYHDISLKELIQIIGQFTTIYDEEGLKKELGHLTFFKKENAYKEKQPLLEDLLQAETIQVIEEVFDWKEAVRQAANPLLINGSIAASYIEAMIENIETLGPYVVIGPEVAIPHARPEKGVNRIGMSFLKLKKPVYFLNNHDYPVRLLFCIAATDNTTHLKALSQLTELLNEENSIGILKELESIEEIKTFFSQNPTID